jgi:cytochrome P450
VAEGAAWVRLHCAIVSRRCAWPGRRRIAARLPAVTHRRAADRRQRTAAQPGARKVGLGFHASTAAELLPLAIPPATDHTAAMEEAPLHVLAAPSHPDPYAWYARLRVSRPLFFDEPLKLWVVSGPYLVQQALHDARLRVRPAGEPVPRALQGRPTGEVFALLVRMNDGDFHARHRPQVEAAASGWSAAEVAQAAEAATRDLAGRCEANALLSAIPVQAMARLLGVPQAQRDATVDWVHAFAQGIAAGASAEVLDRADLAAVALMEQGEREGLSRVAAANRIALMQQAQDATAGLLGNAVRAALASGTDEDAGETVARTAHQDPAVHNTRRFAAEPLELGGERMAAGDALVLVLVPACPFGAGPHACPGERIALQVATSALRTLQSLGPLAQVFGALRGYRPLPNARIPVFDAPRSEPEPR